MALRELTLASDPRRAFLDVPAAELRAWLEARGQPALRVRPLRRWVLSCRATAFDAMTDLPRALRAELAGAFVPLGTEVVRHLTARDGTQKLLLRLGDSNVVECVLMQEADRRTVCV